MTISTASGIVLLILAILAGVTLFVCALLSTLYLFMCHQHLMDLKLLLSRRKGLVGMMQVRSNTFRVDDDDEDGEEQSWTPSRN